MEETIYQVSGIELWKIAPLALLFLSSLIPISIKVFFNRNREPAGFITLIWSLLFLIITGWFVGFQWDNNRDFYFNGALMFDGIASWANILVLIISGLTVLISYKNPSIKGPQFSEIVFLMFSAAIGMMLLISSNDLIMVFIAVELMSLAFYILVGISHEQRLSKEASFKYFVLGSFGSAVLLYGVALIYGTAQTTRMDQLVEVASSMMLSNTLFAIGALMFISGLMFKLSIFPFHAWTPDVYQGAPTPITAFLATGSKLAVFIVLLRFVGTNIFYGSDSAINFLQWLAVLTMLIGNLAAIKQDSMKRMLAYSSIAHSGYALVAIIVSASTPGGVGGAAGLMFYMLTYAFMNIGAFGIVCLFEKDENRQVMIEDLNGFSQRKPLLALCLVVFLVSLAGIPPTAGFFGKFYLFSAAINSGFYWLAFWGMVSSVISVYYYLRPVVKMYMTSPAEDPASISKDGFTRTAILVTVLFIVIIGIASDPFFNTIARAIP